MSKEEGQAVAGAFWSLSPVVAITSSWEGKPNGQIAVTAVTSCIISRDSWWAYGRETIPTASS